MRLTRRSFLGALTAAPLTLAALKDRSTVGSSVPRYLQFTGEFTDPVTVFTITYIGGMPGQRYTQDIHLDVS